MTTPRYMFFLAHAGADTERARELHGLLNAGGVPTFLDAVDLVPGDPWDRKLAEAQREALATVALVSDATDQAYYLRNEIAAGIAYERAQPGQHRLIPVFLDGRPTDPAQIPNGLHVKHALDARALGGLPSVAQELRRVAAIIRDQPAPGTPPVVRHAAERVRLYQALCGLSEADFEQIILLAPAPLRSLAPPQQARPLRARNVVQWADLEGEATYRHVLESALARTPWLAWLEFRRKESALVQVPGPDKEVAFDADDLVVPLQLQLHRRGVGDEQTPHERHSGARSPDVITGGFHDALRVVAQRKLCLGLAIIGDPGSGKTTLLQQIFCAAHANGSQALGLPPDLTPVFVRCKVFERVERPHWSFPALVEAQAAADGHAGAAAALVAEQRPLLLLLDGLDEVRDEDTRQELCAWLSKEALAQRERWRFVVTSRIATWRRQSRLSEEHFLTADVLGLDEPTIRRYVELWFGAVRRRERLNEPEAKIEADAQAQAEALLAELYSDERRRDASLLELMRNPLSLALLCQVHTRHAELPTRRGRLYDACLTVFLERRPKLQDRPYLPADAARAVLRPLAWWMQAHALDDLPRAQVERRVAPELARLSELRDLSPARFVALAWQECGLFRSRDFDSLGFFHAAVREYLAASHAVEARRFQQLAERADEERWHNVTILTLSIERGFSSLARAFLEAGRFAAHVERFSDGLREALSVEIKPFVRALEAAVPDGESARPTTPEDVLAILRLFEGRKEPKLWAAARRLRAHRDERVRRAVAQALALAEPALVRRGGVVPAVAASTPGTLWREPVTGITFVWIPPGDFRMGFTPGRPVRITRGFWMGQHPVTNDAYARFLAATPTRTDPAYRRNARFNKPDLPVVAMSHDDALAFCAWATSAAALAAGWLIALPTEAEWEYTARAAGGDRLRTYPWGDEEPTPERAVFDPSDKTAAVGGRPAGATPLGVHDMAGNVWEWCLDAWQNEIPEGTDPLAEALPDWPATLVVRGGSWIDGPELLRAAHRYRRGPDDWGGDLGFRVVCRGSRQHVGPRPLALVVVASCRRS